MTQQQFYLLKSGRRPWLIPLSHAEIIKTIQVMLEVIHGKTSKLNRLEIIFSDDLEISSANNFFLNYAGPTNVLSFPDKQGNAGYLILSLDALVRECHLYGQPPAEHFLRLLAHGLCHLAGMEHGTLMDRLCDSCIKAARITLLDENS